MDLESGFKSTLGAVKVLRAGGSPAKAEKNIEVFGL
jgi:hypothetical protein